MLKNKRKIWLLSILLALLAVSAWLVFSHTTKSILFVCGGNTGRSPLAESLANDHFHFSNYGYNAFSRGVNVKQEHILPEENAVIVMHQWDKTSAIQDHRATPVTVADIHKASLILAMTAAQKQSLLNLDPKDSYKIFMLSECANGTLQDVDDMYGHDLAFYQETSEKIAYYLQLIKAHEFKCVS